MAELVQTRTTAEILGDSPARSLLQDIFSDIHPGFLEESRTVESIFTPQAATDFLRQLTDLEMLFNPEDTYEQTVQNAIGEKETVTVNVRTDDRPERYKGIAFTRAIKTLRNVKPLMLVSVAPKQ